MEKEKESNVLGVEVVVASSSSPMMEEGEGHVQEAEQRRIKKRKRVKRRKRNKAAGRSSPLQVKVEGEEVAVSDSKAFVLKGIGIQEGGGGQVGVGRREKHMHLCGPGSDHHGSEEADSPRAGAGAGAGAGGGAVKVSMVHLPDVVLQRVIEMLGTPPTADGPDGSHRMAPASFLTDLTAMAQVCQKWKKTVRSSGVWKAICAWRWPWVVSEGGRCRLEEMLLGDPRHRAVCGDENESLWMDLCLRAGRCLAGAGVGRQTDWRWEDDYFVMVDVYTSEDKRR